MYVTFVQQKFFAETSLCHHYDYERFTDCPGERSGALLVLDSGAGASKNSLLDPMSFYSYSLMYMFTLDCQTTYNHKIL